MNDWPAPEPARRCVGTNRAGERCARAPIPGGEVCRMHGGAAPQVRRSAEARLVAMVEPVLAVFEEIVESWHRVTCNGCGHVDERGVKCVGCGHPTGDPAPVIRVGQLILDRAGHHPSLTVRVESENKYAGLSLTEIADRAEEFARLAREMAAAEETARLLPAAADGVLLDDGFEIEDAINTPPSDEPVRSIPPGEGTREPAK